MAANGSLGSLNEDVTLRKTIEFLMENSKEVPAEKKEEAKEAEAAKEDAAVEAKEEATEE
ncbi:hypothetical protein D3C77_306530 [compost metagenome]